MRVLSIIETLQHGGAETVLVDLVTGLRAADHRVVHFSSAHGESVHPWIAGALARHSVPCLDVHWTALQAREARAAVLEGFEPTVVIYHWWGQRTLDPWLSEVRGQPAAERPFFIAVLHHAERPVQPGFDVYVLLTPAQRTLVSALDPDSLHVIPNGVDLARFPVGTRRDSARPFTVGRVSSLRAGKIPADWIRTAAAFALPDAQFVVAGHGELRPALEGDVGRLGLGHRFVLPGYISREEVPRLLATFDVFCYVTSTAIECSPLAVLEACAAGLPIVAEPRGGVLDIVGHERNGLLAGSPSEVEASLRRLQQDAGLRKRLGEGARETAHQFRLERQIAAYQALLDWVARARRGLFEM